MVLSPSKVAVHSFVEKLFRSIWGLTLSRSPFAIKYFFDFLDSQAENMKITDPDVLHIWKTNRCVKSNDVSERRPSADAFMVFFLLSPACRCASGSTF